MAIVEASKCRRQTHRLGVVVVKSGRVVARGHNHFARHAEVAALSKLWPCDRVGTTMYIIRLRKSQPVGMAKPCAKCEDFLRKSGVRKVYYTKSFGVDELKP